MTVKLAVLFRSTYGTNHAMAEIAARAAPDVVVDGQDGWKARVEKSAHLPVATPADMEWAVAYLFSTPTWFGGAPSQVRAFIDTLGGHWFTGKLSNKAISAMTSARNAHGGQEATILSLYTTFFHWGSIIVAPGYTNASIFAAGGNPYGYSHTQGAPMYETAIAWQATRLVAMAAKLAA
jgi:NAD(P)H dehydrogenase (quinone)